VVLRAALLSQAERAVRQESAPVELGALALPGGLHCGPLVVTDVQVPPVVAAESELPGVVQARALEPVVARAASASPLDAPVERGAHSHGQSEAKLVPRDAAQALVSEFVAARAVSELPLGVLVDRGAHCRDQLVEGAAAEPFALQASHQGFVPGSEEFSNPAGAVVAAAIAAVVAILFRDRDFAVAVFDPAVDRGYWVADNFALDHGQSEQGSRAVVEAADRARGFEVSG